LGPSLKPLLAQGERMTGCWVNLFSPLASEILARAGYSCVMIDLEHGPGSVLDAIAVMQAIQGHSCRPLLRVPSNDPVWIKRVLDAGVQGLMVPGVNSIEEAEAAVSSCRYPPYGTRGVAPSIVRASNYGSDLESYMAREGQDLLTICQIESPAAVNAVEGIAEVEGLDMLFIGPYDLSASMGHLNEPDHPEARDAIARTEAAARAAGKWLGGIPTPQRSAADLYRDGYSLVIGDCDVVLMRESASLGAAALRDAIRSGTAQV